MTDEEENKENNKKEEEIVIEENIDEGNSSFQEKVEKLKEKLKKCQELKEEYLNGWQRAKADLINARKDDERRNQEFLKLANAILIFDILPVLDSFSLAFEAHKDAEFSKGVFLIKIQLEDVLKKYGLEEIKSIGEKSNLQIHEIVGEVESEKEEGIITKEIQKGYLLNGKVLRPAKVKVSKSEARSTKSETNSNDQNSKV
jgi:molecular chaperone GrpE